MSGVELATAWVTLVPSMKGFAAEANKSIGQVGSSAEGQGAGIGEKMAAGIGKTLKVGALAVGAAAVAGIGVALVKGFQRLDSIDQATAKLTGLGHSAQTVELVMAGALASVKGTAFGLGEAATTAAGAIASGIKPGKDLERNLKLVADAATIAGTDMGSMGAIFNKVAASNKVQMDVINQLHDAGVPALALLAAQMGVTAEEASKMASRGEIDFATFQAAMESGLGGAALASGDTFSGAMDNMMAAAGRLGADLLTGIFPKLKDGFGDLNTWLDSVGPVAKDVGAKIGEAFTVAKDTIMGVIGWVTANKDWLGPVVIGVGAFVLAFKATLFIQGLMTAWKVATVGMTAAQWLLNAALTANPIGLVIAAIVALVAGLVWFFTQTELGQQIWANFTAALGAAMTWLWETILKPVFDFIGAAWDWLFNNIIKPVITGILIYVGLWAAIFTWLWETIIAPIFALIGEIFAWIWNSIIMPIVDFIVAYVQVLGAIFSWLWANAISPAIDAVGAAFSWLWNTIIKPVADFIGSAITVVGDTIRGVFGGIADFIGAAFQSVLSVVRGPLNALISLINGVIGGLNSISVTIPDWVPEVGGQTFGLSIPKIPRLAEGGIVKSRRGGIIANIGEGRYDEAVVPLTPKFIESLTGERAADVPKVTSGEGVPVDLSGSTIKELVRGISSAVRQDVRMGVI
jgi:tape measure domain-containing protein